jgi:hypothetical protein
MGLTPSLLPKRMTERCSSLVHAASEAAIFVLLLRCRVALLHRTATLPRICILQKKNTEGITA